MKYESYIKPGLIMKTWLFYLVLICHENIDSSFSPSSLELSWIYDLTLLFLVLSSMTWLFYFKPCLWLYSHNNSGLVSHNLFLLFLVLSATTYSCRLWTANHKLSFYFLVWSLRLDFHILNWTNKTGLHYFWSCQHILTFIILVLEFSSFDHPSSLELIEQVIIWYYLYLVTFF